MLMVKTSTICWWRASICVNQQKNSSLLGTYKSVGRFLFGPSTNISRGLHTPSMQRKHKTRDRRCLQQLIKENEYFNCDQLPFQEKHKFSSCSIGAWEDSWGWKREMHQLSTYLCQQRGKGGFKRQLLTRIWTSVINKWTAIICPELPTQYSPTRLEHDAL